MKVKYMVLTIFEILILNKITNFLIIVCQTGTSAEDHDGGVKLFCCHCQQKTSYENRFMNLKTRQNLKLKFCLYYGVESSRMKLSINFHQNWDKKILVTFGFFLLQAPLKTIDPKNSPQIKLQIQIQKIQILIRHVTFQELFASAKWRAFLNATREHNQKSFKNGKSKCQK